MPIHDWTRVEDGIFHHFHHGWIEEISRALNAGRLPDDYYALAEQHAGGFGPDILTLQARRDPDDGPALPRSRAGMATLPAPPQLRPTVETDRAYYRRKQNAVVVRHVSGDRIVAVVEVVSPGNKSTGHAFRSFVEKAAELLGRGVHLLILDLIPPGRRDPFGIHAAIWEEIAGDEPTAPPEKPLTLAAYETALSMRAYVVPVAVGDALPDLPLFLEPEACINVPLEATYQSAFAAVPRRWREVLEA